MVGKAETNPGSKTKRKRKGTRGAGGKAGGCTNGWQYRGPRAMSTMYVHEVKGTNINPHDTPYSKSNEWVGEKQDVLRINSY